MLEIFSPGGMYDGSEIQNRDILNIPSVRRNPVIADVFQKEIKFSRYFFKNVC